MTGETPKAEKSRGEETPREGEHQGKRDDQENKLSHKFKRSSLLHEEGSNFPKKLSKHEDHGEQGHPEDRAIENLPADVTVRDTHGTVENPTLLLLWLQAELPSDQEWLRICSKTL